MTSFKEWFKKLRYKIAYLIAPEWIDDLESRLSDFLWYQTGGLLSKSYYPLNVMLDAANDWQQKICDDCQSNCEHCNFKKEYENRLGVGEDAARRSKAES